MGLIVFLNYFHHHNFVTFHSLTITWGKKQGWNDSVTHIGENAGNLGIPWHHCFVHIHEQDSRVMTEKEIIWSYLIHLVWVFRKRNKLQWKPPTEITSFKHSTAKMLLTPFQWPKETHKYNFLGQWILKENNHDDT